MRDRAGPRRGTVTSAFGVSRREGHDASPFYERFTPPEVSADATVAGHRAVDRVLHGDARSMPEVDDGSVALVVTSPPYFAGKEYETALGEGSVPASYAEYLGMLEDVLAACAAKLEPGGRIAVNVANLGRRPYRSLSADVTWVLQDRLRLLLRGEVVWVKAKGATGSCAWGSYRRPSNPVLRDLTERVVIASKGRFDRAVPARRRADRGLPSEASITSDEFLEATTDVWEIPSERATRVGHPAPFPVGLPERLIHLYTYRGDLVLDPFMGSGSTAVAAVRTGRHFAGYDTDAGYVAAATARVEEERAAVASAGTRADGRADGRAGTGDGRAAREVAADVLAAAGFTGLRRDLTLPEGVDVTFAATDAAGRPWLVDVAGGFTSSRPGLRRADTLWRTIAKAAVVHETRPGARLLVLAPALPPPGSPGAAALDAVTGPGRPVAGVVVLGTPGAAEAVAAVAAG